MEYKWTKFRRPDGTINLKMAYMSHYNTLSPPPVVTDYLEEVELTFPIASRQVAALALVAAHGLSGR